ncbi:MAG: hypothetical protein B7Z68_12570 [Acidobacteria bacterium 21-70-11]|nr:MAG: hypothetical protein B7Z68_12570 [Acidobacteria bacterium 21-70-11]
MQHRQHGAANLGLRLVPPRAVVQHPQGALPVHRHQRRRDRSGREVDPFPGAGARVTRGGHRPGGQPQHRERPEVAVEPPAGVAVRLLPPRRGRTGHPLGRRRQPPDAPRPREARPRHGHRPRQVHPRRAERLMQPGQAR